MITSLWVTCALVSASPPPQEPLQGSQTATSSEEAWVSIEEVIVVTGVRSEEPVGELPYATFQLGASDLGLGRPTLSLGESLNRVPGVLVTARDNYAQDTRISIRGFGSRAAFGVRGIRIFLDGIPLTLPDGQSQLDSLDAANLGRIEVLRGPAGSLYGNAAGGVLYLETKPAPETLQLEASNFVGAFNTWKFSAAARARFGRTSASVFASRTEVGGYRDQSSAEQWVAQARTVTDVTENIRWSTSIQYINAPLAEDAGGLTLQQFRDNPSSAAQTNIDFVTQEAVSQLQVGTRLVVGGSKRHRLEVSAHGGLRDFSATVPFRTIDFARDFYGGLLIYRWSEPTWLNGHRFAVGMEGQAQEDRRGNEGNIDGRSDGVATLIQTEKARSLGFFLQEQLSFSRLTLLGSARYDRVDFRVYDDLLSNGDASGERSFDKLTGQGGLVYKFQPFSIFANISQSYETPTLTELVSSSPDGGLSDDLQAQEALSYEVGIRGRLGRELGFEATTFFIELEQELLASEDALGRTIFTNTGRSRRLGAETYIRWRPIKSLELTGTYAWLHATFEDEGREGLNIPGLPEHRLFARLSYDNGHVFAAAEMEWLAARPANDQNTVHAPPHTLVGLRGGLRFLVGSEWSGEINIGLQNLLDVEYVANIRANAFGDRFFESGAPFQIFGGLKIYFNALEPFSFRL